MTDLALIGMRAISFVERLELEFHGKLIGQQQAHPWSLCQQAIALGDVDNDGVSFTSFRRS